MRCTQTLLLAALWLGCARGPSPLVDAARRGLADDVEALLEEGVDASAPGPFGMTAVEAARAAGFREVADILIAKGAASPRPPEVVADAFLASRFRGDTPGVAVLVSRDGETVFSGAYGYADVEARIPVSTRTQFRIGSVTKQFTATAILLLEQDGRLRVDDPLSKFIPDYPRGDEITLHHLLTHTSGIHDYTDKPDAMETITEPISTADLIASFMNDEFDFAPGEQSSYSNSGYVILAYVIERTSDIPYADFLERRIFEPLGMHDSGVYPRGVDPALEARGHGWEGGRAVDTPNWDMSRVPGAGDIYSTVLDLQKWNEGVFSGRVLPAEALERAFDGGPYHYGYGWGVGRHREVDVLAHSGGLHGFRSQLTRYVEPHATIAVLHNARPAVVQPFEITRLLAGLFLADALAPRPSLRVDRSLSPESFGEYVGRYRISPKQVQIVTLDHGQLYSQITGQDRYPIFPSAPGRFFFKVVDAQIEFLREDDGRISSVRHEQGGGTLLAPRIDDPAEIALAPEALADFVGRYGYGSAVLTVTLEDDGLHAQLSGQEKYAISPIGDDVFVWKIVEARVEFVRDQNGLVTHAVHHQGGSEFEARKLE